MRRTRRFHGIAAACAAVAFAGALSFAGVGLAQESAQGPQPADGTAVVASQSADGTTAAAASQSADDATDAGATAAASADDYTYLQTPDAASGVALKAKAYSADGPIVTELADGRLVQRTPGENISTGYDAEGAYTHPAQNVLYNCAFLKADERGCNACHDDLAALVDNGSYGHTKLSNDMGIDVTVQMCIDCHTVGDGYMTSFYDFGTLIHGIHQDVDGATCASCHNVTADGEGFTLWDVTKHQLMRGITNVESPEGDFSWNQTDVISAEELFNFSWYYRGSDYLRNYREANGDERNTDIYDTWTVTVSGEVNQEVTYTLADLIAQAPSETKAVTMQCTYNPTGGPYIGNCMVTGIPLSWLLEQAGGLTDAAYGMYASSSDGNANSMLVSNLDGKDALLVYQIDGQPLPWEQGFPLMLWVGGTGAPVCTKELSDLIFVDGSDEGVWEYLGWTTEDGEGYYNKPNVGVWGTPEGLCIQAGEPYTFSGYAAAWDQPITAIEFSMDGGQTWVSYETPDYDVNRWMSWQFTWTPPADAETAYTLMVRSVSADGASTPEPVEVMVNAKTDLAAFADEVRAGEGKTDGLAANQAVVNGNTGTEDGTPGSILDDPVAYASALSDGTETPDFTMLAGATAGDAAAASADGEGGTSDAGATDGESGAAASASADEG